MIEKTKKPVIGFACSYNQEKKQIFVNKSYFDAVMKSGGIPVALPYVEDSDTAAEVISRLDGIVFAGGVDVNPFKYGEQIHEKCGEISDIRDLSESIYIKAALNTNIPILGICRGIQAINAFLGGTLYQDIPSQLPDSLNHEKGAAHKIEVVPESLFYKIIGESKINVNSYHHQAVKISAKGIVPVAFSPDGIVEAAEFEGRENFLAVQFHPEVGFDGDSNSKKLFGWFVSECISFRKCR